MRISDWSSDVCSSDLDLALALALRTGALDGEEALLGADLADAATGRAGDRLRAALRAAAVTGVAGDRGGHPDIDLAAVESVLEADLEVVAEIGAAARAGAPSAAHEIAEHLVEDVGESAGEVEAGMAAGPLEGVVPEAIVGSPLLVVLEDLDRKSVV